MKLQAQVFSSPLKGESIGWSNLAAQGGKPDSIFPFTIAQDRSEHSLLKTVINIITGAGLTIVAADAIGFDATAGVAISGSRSLSSLLEFTFPSNLLPFACPQ